MEFIFNSEILQFARDAWSSAVMVIMIFALLFMIWRSQNKYTKSTDKYAEIIKENIKTQQQQIEILKSQNERLKDIFFIINSCEKKPCKTNQK